MGYMFNGQPELSEQALRALGLKGDLPLRLLDPRLSLGIQADDWTKPEYAWARRMRLFHWGSSQAAVAAQYSRIGIGIVVTAQVLAVVQSIHIYNFNPTPQNYRVGLQSASFVTGSLGAPRDSRYATQAAAMLTAASAGATQFFATNPFTLVALNANSGVDLPMEFVLTNRQDPATGQSWQLVVETDQLNVGVAARFSWRERALLDSEK